MTRFVGRACSLAGRAQEVAQAINDALTMAEDDKRAKHKVRSPMQDRPGQSQWIAWLSIRVPVCLRERSH